MTDSLHIQYRFKFSSNDEIRYDLNINKQSLELESTDTKNLPDWTSLQNHQCTNCPLNADEHPFCPIAVNLLSLVHKFGDRHSYDDVQLEVITSERKISAKTTLQRGFSALLGLTMVTSSCPHTIFLRPMARFHLPLASDDETTYRAASMYLLAQYFVDKDGGTPDLSLDGLSERYKDLQIINKAMAKRLRDASEQDATVNAVVLLDLLAKNMPYSIDESLEEIRYLFKAYF